MELSLEETIWDTINDSAIRRFDHFPFKKDFPIDPSNIIFKILVGFVNKENPNIIASQLQNEMLIMGFHWDKAEILSLLEGKERLFKVEIYAAQLASEMLANGDDPLIVYNAITQIL